MKINENNLKITIANKNNIIITFFPLIKYIANKIKYKYFNEELDELASYGVFGLIDAIKKYKKSKNNSFKTYAEFRIRGAILDYLREKDIARSLRDKSKILEKAKIDIESKLGRKANDTEIAEKLKIDNEELYKLKLRLTNTNEAFIELKDDSDPYYSASLVNSQLVIKDTLKTLSENEKKVIELYYYKDKNLKEIGKELQISESRVCQIHSEALKTLKEKLSPVLEDIEFVA
jgi:RNA polymerase sigma factor for flagellar operon FliA